MDKQLAERAQGGYRGDGFANGARKRAKKMDGRDRNKRSKGMPVGEARKGMARANDSQLREEASVCPC